MSTEKIKEYIGTQLKALTSIASPTGFTKNATDYLMKQLEALVYAPSSVGTRICALSRHNEPTKNWTDEGATAYFLRIPFRRYSPFYRNGNHQPASTHQQMAYCRQLDSISFNPYRSF